MILTDIHKAAELLSMGQLVGIPTETVYGLAANALSAEAVTPIFEAKNRPFFDPLIVHMASANQLEKYAAEIHVKAWKLAETFWPGPLTIVLPRQANIPDIVTSGLDTVGLRVPNHEITLELLNLLDFPLAAPSANPFGYISPTTAQHVHAQLHGKIAAVLDGGACTIGVESAIVHVSKKGQITLLRQGGTTLEELNDCIGDVDVQLHSSSNPKAPGMLASHYAPRTPLLLGTLDELPEHLKSVNLAYLSLQTKWPNYPGIALSSDGSLNEAARNLFSAMRELDRGHYDLIVAEKMPERGLGRAINDRLFRAASSDPQ
jgi:L-threonylcarbamoyladenylate synthase